MSAVIASPLSPPATPGVRLSPYVGPTECLVPALDLVSPLLVGAAPQGASGAIARPSSDRSWRRFLMSLEPHMRYALTLVATRSAQLWHQGEGQWSLFEEGPQGPVAAGVTLTAEEFHLLYRNVPGLELDAREGRCWLRHQHSAALADRLAVTLPQNGLACPVQSSRAIGAQQRGPLLAALLRHRKVADATQFNALRDEAILVLARECASAGDAACVNLLALIESSANGSSGKS